MSCKVKICKFDEKYIGQLIYIFGSQKYCSLIHKLLTFTCTGLCSHFLIYSHTFLQWFRTKGGAQGTLPREVYKFVCLATLIAHSWRHPVLTSGCILGMLSNTTSSANANAVVHYHVLFKRAFHFGFLPSKPFLFR